MKLPGSDNELLHTNDNYLDSSGSEGIILSVEEVHSSSGEYGDRSSEEDSGLAFGNSSDDLSDSTNNYPHHSASGSGTVKETYLSQDELGKESPVLLSRESDNRPLDTEDHYLDPSRAECGTLSSGEMHSSPEDSVKESPTSGKSDSERPDTEKTRISPSTSEHVTLTIEETYSSPSGSTSGGSAFLDARPTDPESESSDIKGIRSSPDELSKESRSQLSGNSDNELSGTKQIYRKPQHY